MNLFSKEKEFVLKLINGILLIWIIVATVIIFSNIINLFIKDPELTYEEYKVINCIKNSEENDIDFEKNCQDQYKAVDINNRNQDYYYYRSIAISLANILIVASVMTALNNRKTKPIEKSTTKNKK